MSFDIEPEYELTKEDYDAWEKRIYKEALEKIALLDSGGNPLGCQSHLECIHTAQEALGMHRDIPELDMQGHIKASGL